MRANLIASVCLLGLLAVIGWMIWTGSKSEEAVVRVTMGSQSTVLMDFYADWCGPCQAMKPLVHSLAEDMRGKLVVMEINVDENPELARQFNVRSIPCFVVTQAGKEVSRQVGTMPKESLRQLTGL